MGSQRTTRIDKLFDEDTLILIEGLARDGYTNQDIALRLGIDPSVLYNAKRTRPEINAAINRGKQIVDYKVENALLKSALGYKTKETKVTTIMRYGKVVEEQTETLEKEVAPNSISCQVWLYNRCPDKWKRNRDKVLEDEEEATIQVTVKRATDESELNENESWSDVNKTVTVKNKKQRRNDNKKDTEDLDYWPDDWTDEEEW
jgi:hypothetical protein